MPYVRVHGVSLRYQVTGDGPPLLLLPGLGRCLEHWLDLEPALARRFTVIAADLRGAGGSDAPAGRYSTANLADEMAGLLDALRFDGRVHVLGHCLGGMVAQELALRHPDRVDRLILAATSAGGPETLQSPSPALWALLLATTLPPRAASVVRGRFLLSHGFLAAHPSFLDRWHAIEGLWPRRSVGLAGQLAAFSRHRADDRLSAIPHPTLILHGDADRFVAPAAATVLASRIPAAHLYWLDGAGHDLAAERPLEVEERVVAFLERDGGGIPPGRTM